MSDSSTSSSSSTRWPLLLVVLGCGGLLALGVLAAVLLGGLLLVRSKPKPATVAPVPPRVSLPVNPNPKFGGKISPDFKLPKYPGSDPQSVPELNGTLNPDNFVFHSADPAARVIAFYNEKLEAAGFNVQTRDAAQLGQDNSGQLFASDADGLNTVSVIVHPADDGTGVTVAVQTTATPKPPAPASAAP